MIYYTIPPAPSLAPYIKCFWVLESNVGSGKPYIHRTLAGGCPELLFHYKGVFKEIDQHHKEESSFVSGIHAQSKQYRRFIIGEDFCIFGVCLYPFAIPQLFGIPSSELSDHTPDLQTLFGLHGSALEEQVMLAKNNEERVRIVSAFLEQQLHTHHTRQTAVIHTIRQIIHQQGKSDVQQLAESSFLSVRQFERTFKHYAGFSPKLFTRIIRFQQAMKQYGREIPSMSAFAQEAGYYDQSHFIHDFKAFSGYNPGEFFSASTEATAYLS